MAIMNNKNNNNDRKYGPVGMCGSHLCAPTIGGDTSIFFSVYPFVKKLMLSYLHIESHETWQE